MGLFGFGKEEKIPFKIPREVSEFRMRIEVESRERFPSLARYQEITKVSGVVYQYLNNIIAKKEHAEEAARVREDIKKKLEALGEKIKKNMQEAQKEEKQDYVERNIDYLARKSMRNNAKTVFTELLEGVEAFTLFAKGERLPHDKKIEAVIPEIFGAVAELHNNYFKSHGEDKEIQTLKENTLAKLVELDAVFNEHRARFRHAGLEANIEMYLNKYRKHD